MNVYILELKDDKYYVGLTSDMSHRYKSHCRGRGSSWTKEHSPIKIISIEEGDKYLERKITLEMMKKYGWENVRWWMVSKESQKSSSRVTQLQKRNSF
jgi:predicted GIY-YIG superfamily endonuclease